MERNWRNLSINPTKVPVEFLKLFGQDPRLLRNSSPCPLQGKLLQRFAIDFKMSHIANPPVAPVPAACNLIAMLLIQHWTEEGLLGKTRRNRVPTTLANPLHRHSPIGRESVVSTPVNSAFQFKPRAIPPIVTAPCQ